MSFRKIQGHPQTEGVVMQKGDALIAKVKGVRESERFQESYLFECEALSGEKFLLTAHAVMMDRIESTEAWQGRVFGIRCLGKEGRYYDYEVNVWEGTGVELASEPGVDKMMDATLKLIAGEQGSGGAPETSAGATPPPKGEVF